MDKTQRVFSNRKMSLKEEASDGRGKLLSGLDGESLAASEAVGMWETRSSRFPRKKGNPRCCFLGIFLLPSFPLPFGLRSELKLLEEFAFGLLHAVQLRYR